MPPPVIFISVLLLSLQWKYVSPRSDSLRELRKLMRQQDESSTASPALQFNQDISVWARGLERLGLDIALFVEKCRQRESRCQQRRVTRKLRVLRHGYTELKARLEALEVKFVGRVGNQEAMDATLQTVKAVLRQYDETFHMIEAQIYKLVDQ